MDLNRLREVVNERWIRDGYSAIPYFSSIGCEVTRVELYREIYRERGCMPYELNGFAFVFLKFYGAGNLLDFRYLVKIPNDLALKMLVLGLP